MKNPKWLCRSISDDALQEIEDAVKSAELKTSGEIIPFVVERSAVITHVPLVLFSFLSMAFALIDYNGHISFYMPVHIPQLVYIFVFLLLSLWLGQIPLIQRICSTKRDLSHQVQTRAIKEFYHAEMHRTKDRTGIMIFISLMEKQVVVLADKGIAAKLPPQTWQKVIELILTGKKQKNLSNGLIQGITKCGELLSEHFPRMSDDQDELSNKLIIKSFSGN